MGLKQSFALQKDVSEFAFICLENKPIFAKPRKAQKI